MKRTGSPGRLDTLPGFSVRVNLTVRGRQSRRQLLIAVGARSPWARRPRCGGGGRGRGGCSGRGDPLGHVCAAGGGLAEARRGLVTLRARADAAGAALPLRLVPSPFLLVVGADRGPHLAVLVRALQLVQPYLQVGPLGPNLVQQAAQLPDRADGFEVTLPEVVHFLEKNG